MRDALVTAVESPLHTSLKDPNIVPKSYCQLGRCSQDDNVVHDTQNILFVTSTKGNVAARRKQ